MPPILLLIPTEFEISLVKERAAEIQTRHNVAVAICGFGPVIPAAISTEKLLQLRPRLVILCGIAGAYVSAGLKIGAAYEFSDIGIDGVGAGRGPDFKTSSQLGWPQFAGDEQRSPISNSVNLGTESGLSLLTVCSASQGRDHANDRQQRYAAHAEDMEGFAVAAACRLQQVPLRVVRGISNVAGDREHAHWKTADAMTSAFDLVNAIVEKLAPESDSDQH